MDILLVDDHAAMRKEIASLINEQEDMHVIGQAENGEEGLRLAKELQPGVVVIDLVMPGMNGIVATEAIGKQLPDIKILALSNHTGKNLLEIVLGAGANGFVRKDRAYEELVPAIRAVASNQQYIGERCND